MICDDYIPNIYLIHILLIILLHYHLLLLLEFKLIHWLVIKLFYQFILSFLYLLQISTALFEIVFQNFDALFFIMPARILASFAFEMTSSAFDFHIRTILYDMFTKFGIAKQLFVCASFFGAFCWTLEHIETWAIIIFQMIYVFIV